MTIISSACGFDFGTSNSAIGLAAKSRPSLISLQDDRVSIPTAVFFSFEDSSVSFGREAVSRYLHRENGRLLRSLKSLLGSTLIHEQTQLGKKRLGSTKSSRCFWAACGMPLAARLASLWAAPCTLWMTMRRPIRAPKINSGMRLA